MEVMKPELEWIEGICYRINPGNYSYISHGRYEEHSYEQDDVCPIETTEDENLEEIEEIEGGRLRLGFHVSKIYFSYIIGSKGATKKRLEAETRTRILIPKPGFDGDIVVTGVDRKSLISAKTRILMMVISSRKRRKFTHFISMPFNSSSFKSGFLTFKEEVLKSYRDRGVDESIFQTPEKLHLTICMLVLGDDIERANASLALDKCKEEIISPLLSGQPLKITLSGIDYLNDDPSNIRVLYGKVSIPEDPQLLQTLVDAIDDFFVKRGIADRVRDHVTLHVTLMNTRFRNKDSDDSTNEKDTFDGSRIIDVFRDFSFGCDYISKFEISVLHSVSTTGYYQATSSVEIP